MAEQTQTPIPARRGHVADGAGATAPTAPHATPPTDVTGARTGPARFWSARVVRQGLGIGFVVSAVFHYWIAPFSVLPEGPAIEFHEQAGELTIPVEILEGVGDKPSSEQQGVTSPNAGSGANAGMADAAVQRGPDAGALATLADADVDGNPNTTGDAGETQADDAGLIALVDAGGRDPRSILGAAGAVSAGPDNVTVMVNFAELRSHPEASRVDAVLGGIPQWKEFMSNASGTALLDPMRDADWMLIMGPSLVETQNDAVFVHYSVDDAIVDHTIEQVSKKYSKGGPMNVGVPRVKAWRAFADNGERVFLRPRSHLAVIVPATHATQFARVLAAAPVTPRVHPGEAVSIRALRPGGSISVIPQSITEMRMWLVPRAADSGADLYVEGDTADEATANATAEEIRNVIRQKNSFAVRFMTAGIFNNVDITASGKEVHGHMSGTRDQVEAILGLVASKLHLTVPPPSNGAPPPPPSASAP